MELVPLLTRIDELKAEIDALRPLDPWREKQVLQRFRFDWNYHSNAIEGNTLSYGETRLFLLHGLTAKGKPFKDYLDVRGHNHAINYLFDMVRQEIPLTEHVMRELHKILLVEPYELEAETADGQKTKRTVTPGQYKTKPNHVRTRSGEIFFFAAPEETAAQMADLMSWLRVEEEREELHPVLIAATFHYRFVRIHPFDDGNGRMARLLMNLLLMQAGYVPVIIKFEKRESAYFPALEAADRSGDLSPFFRLIAEELIHSLALYLSGLKGEYLDNLDDLDDHLRLLKEQLKLVKERQIEELTQYRSVEQDLIEHSLKPLLNDCTEALEKITGIFENTQVEVIIEESRSRETIQSAVSTVIAYFERQSVGHASKMAQLFFSFDGLNFDRYFFVRLIFEIQTLYSARYELVCRLTAPQSPDFLFHLDLDRDSTADFETSSNEFLLEITNKILEFVQMKAATTLS